MKKLKRPPQVITIDSARILPIQSGVSFSFWVSVDKYIASLRARQLDLFAFSAWLLSLNRKVLTANYLHVNRIEFAESLKIPVEKYDSLVIRCIKKGYLVQCESGFRISPIKETKKDFTNNYEGLNEVKKKREISRRSGAIPSNFKVNIESTMSLAKVKSNLQEIIITSIQAERISAQGSKNIFEQIRNGSKIKNENCENFNVSVRQIAEKSGSSFTTIAKSTWSRGKVSKQTKLIGKVPPGSNLEQMISGSFVNVQRHHKIERVPYQGYLYQIGSNVIEVKANIYEQPCFNQEIAERLMEIKRCVLGHHSEKDYKKRVHRAKAVYKYVYQMIKGRENRILIIDNVVYPSVLDIPKGVF